jgi:hypothetical protein
MIKNKRLVAGRAASYGSYVDPNTQKPFWSAREGDKMLMISSGGLPPPDGQGAVIVADGDVYNDAGVGGEWDSDVMPPADEPGARQPRPDGLHELRRRQRLLEHDPRPVGPRRGQRPRTRCGSASS